MVERSRKTIKDNSCWRCFNRACVKYKTTKSIREGSFFKMFRLSLSDIWTVVVLWLADIPACNVTQLYEIERKSVLSIFALLREAVSRDLDTNPVRLGGQGIVCQIDESHLAFRSKYGVGRVPNQQQWAFGIVDASFTPSKGYMELVSSRSREVLLPIIERVCRPGSIIHSDCWAAYRQINASLGFDHSTVNHKFNFTDPVTGAHTQNIESYWNRVKRHIKRMNGCGRNTLPMFVNEFVWKDFHRERALFVLLGLLSVYNYE